jgi:hypothetical protein
MIVVRPVAHDKSPVEPVLPWPPPAAVRWVLRATRARYHSAPLVNRPSLRCSKSWVGLLTLHDMLKLQACAYWPLPAGALAWIGEPPRERARRHRRQERHIVDVVRDVLAVDLPEAVRHLDLTRSGKAVAHG